MQNTYSKQVSHYNTNIHNNDDSLIVFNNKTNNFLF